ILYRLLKDFDPNAYCLISSSDYGAGRAYYERLPARYHRLPPEHRVRAFALVQRSRNIGRILREESCEAVIACTADILNLPATYLASRMARVPFYIFMFDHYVYQWVSSKRRAFAHLIAPLLVRSAERTIVLNEFMACEIADSYGGTPVIIRPPCEMQAYRSAALARKLLVGSSPRIVYTGALYEANNDAFINLLRALELVRDLGVTLHLYSEQRLPESIAQIAPDLLEQHGHRGLRDMPDIQMEADILFLPLAFASAYPEIIRLSFPSKTPEYLAS